MDKLLGQKVKEINDFYNSIIIHTENNTQHELNLEDIFGSYSAYKIVGFQELVGHTITEIHKHSNIIQFYTSMPVNTDSQSSYIYAAGIQDIDSVELSPDKDEIRIHAYSLKGNKIQLIYFKKINSWSLSAFSKEKLPNDLQRAIDEINLFKHPKIKQITDNLNRENAERVSGHMRVYFNSKLNK